MGVYYVGPLFGSARGLDYLPTTVCIFHRFPIVPYVDLGYGILNTVRVHFPISRIQAGYNSGAHLPWPSSVTLSDHAVGEAIPC